MPHTATPEPGSGETVPDQPTGNQPVVAPVTDARALRALTIGLCIGITAVAFETLAVTTAMPRAAEELGALEWYAWAFSIFQAAMLFATVAAGRLCDRLGPVKPMAAGMIIFGIGLAVAGTAASMPMLVAGRAVQGFGSGMMSVALYVVIARYFPVERRPQTMSWMSTAWVVPGFLGPPISGWITENLSWHWVFGAVVPVLAVAAVLLVPILVRAERSQPTLDRPGPDTGARKSPVWAAATAALAVPILQFALQTPGWWSIPMVVVAIVLLAVGLPRLMPAGIWRLKPGLGPVVTVRALIGGTYFATESFAILMLVEIHGLDLRLAGLMFTAGTIGWTTGAFLQARWRIRRDLLMTYGSVSLALGVLSVALIAWSGTSWFWLVAIAWIVSGLGMGTAFASTSVATMRLSSDAEQGRNAASLQLSEALGASLLAGLAGAGFAWGMRVAADQPTLVFGLLFAGLTVTGLLAVLASRRIGPVDH